MKNFLKVIAYLLAFTAPIWFIFIVTFLLSWLGEAIYILLFLGSVIFFGITMQGVAKLVDDKGLLIVLFMLIYLPIAIFCGFFAGWGGLLAGGVQP